MLCDCAKMQIAEQKSCKRYSWHGSVISTNFVKNKFGIYIVYK